MASYVGLVKVIFTLIVAFFAVLVNLISHGKFFNVDLIQWVVPYSCFIRNFMTFGSFQLL